MEFDILRQVKEQVDDLNEQRKKQDAKAADIKLEAYQADHLNQLQSDLEKLSDSGRRVMEDASDLKRKGIDMRPIIDGAIKDIKRVFGIY